jgi:hypothetical protein
VLQDLLEQVGNAEGDGLRAALKARKAYFKRYFSEMTTDDFVSIWKVARSQFLVARAEKGKSSKGSSAILDVVNLSGEKEQENADLGHGADNLSSKEKTSQKEKETNPRPKTNRWSKLFLGPGFNLGDEFTMDTFEEMW